MGAEQSNMGVSGGASSRGWSGSSYSSSDAGTSMSPPNLIRRMSQGAGSAFPSLKLGDTLLPHQKSNPAAQPSGFTEPSSPTSMGGDLGRDDFAKLRAAKNTAAFHERAQSMPTSDIPQPTATIDEFAPGDQQKRAPHEAHITHLTHPWHKATRGGSNVQKESTSAYARSPPLAKNVASFSRQVLGMADDDSKSAADTASKSSSTTQQPFMSSTLASTKLTRRMSTGSIMLPPKEGPFDASPDELHREFRLASSHTAPRAAMMRDRDAVDAAPARRPRAASLSAEAADKFAGGFPW